MNRLPISLRLTIWYSSLLLLALVVFGLISFHFVSKELYDEQIGMLSEAAEQISEFLELKDGGLNVERLDEETDELNLHENGVFFEICSNSMTPLFRSRNFPLHLSTSYAFPPEGSRKNIHDDAGNSYSLFTASVRQVAQNENKIYEYRIRTGQNTLYVQRILHRIRSLMLPSGPIVLLVAGFGGWVLARRSLAPVASITAAARQISLYQLDKRLSVPVQRDELQQLVQTFNEMIERIQQGVHKIQQFTADASHELRTPLTIMRGEIEVALRKKRTAQGYVTILRSSLQELSLMEKIVNDLLLLSRADAGQLSLQKVKTDMVALVQECLALQRPVVESKGIKIELNAKEPLFATVDADRMRQVVTNLLDNAIKYTMKGGAIAITLKEQDNKIALSIKDNGIGIAEKDLPFVFDRFYRADKSRSRERRSSGLGLAICKWIVEAHNGKINIDSQVGRGTTVRIEFPRSV